MMDASPALYQSLREDEGKRLSAYCCPSGVWTIGYGSTSGVKKGMTITEQEAEKRLRDDVAVVVRQLNDKLRIGVTQGQFDALVSFLFNVGPGRAKGTLGPKDEGRDGLFSLRSGRPSTLWRLLNAGDVAGAADQFLMWANGTDPATGKLRKLPGLVKRREKERRLFLASP